MGRNARLYVGDNVGWRRLIVGIPTGEFRRCSRQRDEMKSNTRRIKFVLKTPVKRHPVSNMVPLPLQLKLGTPCACFIPNIRAAQLILELGRFSVSWVLLTVQWTGGNEGRLGQKFCQKFLSERFGHV